MKFSEELKTHTDEKYTKLLSGKSEYAAMDMSIPSCDEYKEKYQALQDRLQQENDAVNKALDSIRSKKEEEKRLAFEIESLHLEEKRIQEEHLEKESHKEQETKAPIQENNKNVRKRRELRVIDIIIIVVIVIVAISVLVFSLINNKNHNDDTAYDNTVSNILTEYKDPNEEKYQEALTLYAQNNYGEAYQILKSINGYKDSAEQMSKITSTVLEKAEILANSGKYTEAYKLIELVEFNESSNLHQAYTYASEGNFAEAVDYGLTVVVFPEGTQTIPEEYFKSKYNIKKVVLPSTIKVIGKSAFYECYNLAEINLPIGLTIIDNYAFYNCKALKTIEIPDSVESLGSNAFEECIGLEKVSISSRIKTISSDAFRRCSSLTTITVSNGIEVIGSGAFSDCSALVNIALPNTLKEIKSGAFDQCRNLSEITIPSQVNLIESSAFAYCSSLQMAYFENQVGWQVDDYTKIDVSDAKNNAREFKDVARPTWERK